MARRKNIHFRLTRLLALNYVRCLLIEKGKGRPSINISSSSEFLRARAVDFLAFPPPLYYSQECETINIKYLAHTKITMRMRRRVSTLWIFQRSMLLHLQIFINRDLLNNTIAHRKQGRRVNWRRGGGEPRVNIICKFSLCLSLIIS